ncbi:MaoC family dehydratase [Luteithermobacter gelatinilyticus]|uniref:MaoC family dehydratase n=1 Tax=Luteithermobacter gelatinilyticus TaxID=2582913 RepID=UPI00110710BE|nr:MaoC family dehydratase [Luteithermobacter gelatinilyticus]|tara:strand:+ start:3875 stop:4972 length:1098 start_codon:yes stop_codon:yes gene_type:complete
MSQNDPKKNEPKTFAKTFEGNYFEDFQVGQELIHATPRTVTAGDMALYTALYGNRFAVQSSTEFARSCGLTQAPADDLLTFHIVFGKTVPDISINAVANLGYADCRFLNPVYPGDTLSATSQVIGLKENSSGKNGNVYVRTTGYNQRGEKVLEYVRWVMVNKKSPQSPAPKTEIPDLPDTVAASDLTMPPGLTFRSYDRDLAGSPYVWEDYDIGEKINHVDGMTVEAADHMMATRLYQNTAKVHFNQHMMKDGRLGERIVYGGHVISLARALSYNGLGNAQFVAAINAGRHVNPCIAGDTVYAWTEILDKAELSGSPDVGALRVRLVAVKDRNPADFPYKDKDGKYDPSVLLDLDLWVLMPRATN